MRRAIKDLCQFDDSRLFKEVEEGISHLLMNVDRLDAAAHRLSAVNDHQSARILGSLAQEEAAKVFILLDAVRCPTNKPRDRKRTLGYFYDHLAKGIYAALCSWSLENFGQVACQVSSEREQFYLDGPSNYDWIFPNQITNQREFIQYVDFICDDTDDTETSPGERYWQTPPAASNISTYHTPRIVYLAKALHRIKATSSSGLSVIARIWREFEPRSETSTSELIEMNALSVKTLEENRMFSADVKDEGWLICQRWMFPLWPLNLGRKDVKKSDLRQIRKVRLESLGY
ncbi:MAG: AbiV family abortive infection protein [Gemmatimonadota bacterium]|nr:AbiV family abortive infection protein [Gemmatimonadota bacterium]